MYSMESDSKLKNDSTKYGTNVPLAVLKASKKATSFCLCPCPFRSFLFHLCPCPGQWCEFNQSHGKSTNAQPAFELLPLLPFPQCLDFWEIRRLRWTGSALLKSGCSILLQNHGKIHLKPPRNSRLIVQMRMFHYVTTVQQVWNTQSPTQNSYEHS